MQVRGTGLMIVLAIIFGLTSCVSKPPRTPSSAGYQKVSGNWSSYASDQASSKYSALSQINSENVQNVKVIWRWQSPDNQILAEAKGKNEKLVADGKPIVPEPFVFYNESTPLAIDGFLYVSTAMSQVSKIDGRTGQTIWTYDPRTYDAVLKGDFPPNNGYVHRGVTYWQGAKGDARVYVGTGDAYLIALNAETGKIIEEFGTMGRVDLLQGLSADGKTDWPSELRYQYAVTSPVTVCQGVVIVGASIMDSISKPTGPRGDVRGFDAKTGKLKWTFHTIPLAGQPGADTWKNNSNEYTGNANVWTMMSADESMGLAYLPVGTPTNDWYGGKRLGDGLYGESLVCVSCATGAYKWHSQLVHHGLWDYDPPAAPNLVDIPVNGKTVKAVVQVTKQAFAYAFNRETGEPIWPLREMPVAKSLVEDNSPTQPKPVKPGSAHKDISELKREDFVAFDLQGVRKSELIDFSPELYAKAEAIIDQYNYGELYFPPTVDKKGTIILPGWLGGASWAGAANQPGSNILYVSSQTQPWAARLVKSTPAPGSDPKLDPEYTSPFLTRFVTGLDNKPPDIPLFKPPYGRVSAIDLSTGEIKWMTPIGKGPVENPQLKVALAKSKWAGKDLGWSRRVHLLLTNDLLFAAQAGDFVPVGGTPKGNSVKIAIIETEAEQVLRVLDPNSGKILAELKLNQDADGKIVAGASGNAYGAPMTYLDAKGRQIVVVPVGGANKPAELVALALNEAE